MEKKTIRLLKENEIECRVASISEKGLSLLLYKDARVDQKILDETFGIYNWQRTHQCIDGSIYCTVSIYDQEKKEWISKQDVGSAGFAEKEKSLASDSFKRACFSVGVGRELYTAPFIWISADKATIKQKDGRFYCNTRFSVASIKYNDDREISALKIVDDKANVVYELYEKRTVQENSITQRQMDCFNAELRRTGVDIADVKQRYGFREPEKMSGDMYRKVMSALAKTESIKAA